MNKILNIIILAIITFVIISCGNPVVDVGSNTYQPKIVIDGYLFPETKVENININRNFPVNTTFDQNSIAISDASVKLTDLNTNIDYVLTYDPDKKNYTYKGNDLIIGYQIAYKLTVSAIIDGQKLNASSITITPQKGFEIDRSSSSLGTFNYRETDQNGEIKPIKIVFIQSPGTDFYAYGLKALDASKNGFIYQNPYFDVQDTARFNNQVDTTRINNRIKHDSYGTFWVQNLNLNGGTASIDISYLDIWFWGRYQVVLYAGDQNFKDYYLTHDNVLEIDGNLHDPKFHIEGDGIGVFGSAITDTVYFDMQKN